MTTTTEELLTLDDIAALYKVSRHKDLSLLMNTYYRESEEEIAARI